MTPYLPSPIFPLLMLDFPTAYTPLMISHILVVYHLLYTIASQVNFQLAISCLHLGILQASYSLNCYISKTELIILHISFVPWLNYGLICSEPLQEENNPISHLQFFLFHSSNWLPNPFSPSTIHCLTLDFCNFLKRNCTCH